MQLPQIRLESTFAKIGLNIQKPIQEMEQPKAEMNLHQEPAIMDIRQATGDLSIDSSRARASIGLRTSMQFSDMNAQYGYQQLMSAIARISQEGDQLAAIHTKRNAIADIASTRGFLTSNENPPPSASDDEGVDVNYQLHPVEINVERRGMKMDPVLSPPILKYTPGKVEGYMQQYNSLKIDVVGSQLDRMI